MKTAILSVLVVFLSLPSLATVDGTTTVHLMTYDYNNMLYDVAEYQYTGCYGLEYGPQAAAFTEPFMVEAPRGCGGPSYSEDVNALSCASSEYEWSEGHEFVLKVKLDISKCEIEPEAQTMFEIMARKAARKNFGDHVQVDIQ